MPKGLNTQPSMKRLLSNELSWAIPIYQARFYGYQWSGRTVALFPYLQRMDDNRPLIVEERIAQWCGSYGYVENVAAAIALAVTNERATGRIYHVADSEVLSEAERLSRVGQVAGCRSQVVAVPRVSTRRMELAIQPEQHWFVDTTRIRQN